jgi:hypothetical protein
MQTIPNEMRVAATDRFGGPERLSIHMLPVPVPDAREVLFAVDTAGVGYHRNRLLRRDRWRPRFPTSRARRGSGETEGADAVAYALADAAAAHQRMAAGHALGKMGFA